MPAGGGVEAAVSDVMGAEGTAGIVANGAGTGITGSAVISESGATAGGSTAAGCVASAVVGPDVAAPPGATGPEGASPVAALAEAGGLPTDGRTVIGGAVVTVAVPPAGPITIAVPRVASSETENRASTSARLLAKSPGNSAETVTGLAPPDATGGAKAVSSRATESPDMDVPPGHQ